MQLGRLGAWYSTDKLGGPQQIKAFAQTVERLGYDTWWYPESRGYESLSVGGFILSQTTKLKLGSSIASIRRGILRCDCFARKPGITGTLFLLRLSKSYA